MKLIIFSTVYVLLLACLVSCNSKELTRDRAFDVIEKYKYGKLLIDTVRADITVDNPYIAARYKELTLEKDGFWKLDTNVKAKQNIFFTEKSNPYLIDGVKKRREGSYIRGYTETSYQRLAIGIVEADEVTGIELEPGDRKATVELKYKFTATPFIKTNPRVEAAFLTPKIIKISMSLYDDGWRIEDVSYPKSLF
ncbi:hypothetical protein [uncultured Fibrella sp.]|uniref:hypothetical protein n=1 Tax=uncultured Fibrella sp. TaxID=1284596 RepID=UPI0035CB30FB